ncbi:autotransporter domain-containing protein [Brucella rhizosphaerae]|uniref:Putative outer membrane autotransporter barrel domain-containing protein n=1 Tax=Brucella rhizosphaerae TaxID=571254 RepID=A0A256F3K6_9HYPH|nr:autotransporter domain-containing protein [Brucella rhizosphaerae]OYR09437.1 putative outer membrane autotransporter barrel domain-containing protein [Brucella rhizosphaerae]
MKKYKLLIKSTILSAICSQAWAETPVFEVHGSFGGARADAASISADGKTIGIRRMSAGGAYDKSFIVTPDGITDIGSLSGSDATALLEVSANGLAAIGSSAIYSTQSHAFWWSRETGIRDIGTLGGSVSSPKGISASGTVVAGDSYLAGDTITNSFRWTLQDGITNLGHLGGDSSFTNAISADGSTIIGYSSNANFNTHAFRWTQAAGMVSLQTLGGNNSSARGVSADGSVVVGASDTANNQQHAFRWTANTGMIDIDTHGNQESIANLVSGDGMVVVGSATFNGGFNQAFRWTQQSGMISLNSLGGGLSHALSMTTDGSAVVGYSYTDTMALRAFRWTASDGMIDLGTIGGNSAIAWDVSSDGSVIAGTAETASGELHATLWKFPKPDTGTPPTNPGTNPETPTNPGTNPGSNPGSDPGSNPGTPSVENPPVKEPEVAPKIIDVDHTVATVFTLASNSFSAMEAQRLTLNKLQGFCDVERAGQTCYSLFTDISGFGDQKDLLSGFTLGHGFTDNFSAGVTIAHSFWRDQPDGFDAGNDNFGGGLYAQWKDKTAIGDWYMRASLAANRYDTDITRPVLAYTEAGTGESRLQGWSTALELGRTDSLSFRNARIGYYGGLRYSHLSMDGYTESNALFPFTYGDMKYELTTAYAGANYSMPLTERIRWSINLEIEQDLAHNDPEFSAKAEYIGALALDPDFSHARGSAWTSLSYAVNETVDLSLTPYVTRTASRDNAFGAMVRISGKF